MTTTITAPVETIAEGFTLAEGPRWRNGKLYFSDMFAHRICTVDDGGRLETLLEVDDKPSGLGFMPNGDLLFVLMHSAKVMRLGTSGVTLHADLAPFADADINDMAVGPTGRAYVGQLGFDYSKGEERRTTSLIRIEPDGAASVAARDLWGPNGIVLSADGRTLVTAEASGWQITAFDIDGDGSLSGRRLFARPPEGHAPDGICMDSRGGIWAAIPVALKAPGAFGPGFMRFEEGGRVTHLVPMPEGRRAIACAFGGADRRTLYLCTTDTFIPDEARAQRGARIERVRLEFAGAGVP